MAVSYNQSLGVWQVNGRGAYGSQAEASAAESGGAPAPANNTATYTGAEGPTVRRAADPNDQPNPANPGGVSNNQLARDQRAETARLAATPYGTPVSQGGTANGYAVTQAKLGRDAQKIENGHPTVSMYSVKGIPGEGADGFSAAYSYDLSGNKPRSVTGDARGGTGALGAGGGGPPGLNVPGVEFPGEPGGPPPAAASAPVLPGASETLDQNDLGKNPPAYATVDYSRFDQGLADMELARNNFMSELDRLSGVDPFGNQAFLQQSTDRAVAQAAGTAAMARGGGAAMAGAQRGALGTQAHLATQGAQQAVLQRNADEIGAGQLRNQAASGIAGLATNRAGMEADLTKLQTETLSNNLTAWIQHQGITLPIAQSDVENMRQIALQYKQIDMERYKTDVGYRENVDNNILGKYQADTALKGIKAQIDATGDITTGEFFMGLLGAGAGLATAGIMKSDRRSKTDIRDPDLRDLQDFLGTTRGKLYRYKQPSAPGQREGLNFGPMAQDLMKSKIGRTTVVEREDGLYVDAARLALADHSALAALAADVARMKKARGAK